MANKNFNTRIQLKSDTEANWNKATNFIPLKGEAIIYSVDSAHPFSRLKIGDGVTIVKNLPFLQEGPNIYINTSNYWNEMTNYVPKNGDIIIYSDKTIISKNNSSINIPGVKIGDGNAYCIDLPFLGDDIIINLTEHISNMQIHITSEERNAWNNKLNCSINDEILIFTRS